MENGTQKSPLRINFILLLFIIAVLLNWPWEMLQMLAYREMAHRSWSETAWMCFRAGLGDGLITVFVYSSTVLVCYVFSKEKSIMRMKNFATLAILGGIVAVAIERLALSAGRWSYSSAMPIVPIFEVGLMPLLQLIILIPLAVKLTFLAAGEPEGPLCVDIDHSSLTQGDLGRKRLLPRNSGSYGILSSLTHSTLF